MDILIENGDFAANAVGYPIEIYSVDEACQRVKMILSTKKGSFIYDRNFGADFSTLFENENVDSQAQLLCREAVADQKEISIGSVSVVSDENEENKFTLNVEVLFDGQSKLAEVVVSGEL